ncbi:MAG: FHA domain-containing protein [Ktedonobacterales bacterium]
MAYIEIETPEGTKRVPLERDHLTIGRLSYNDIVLPSAQISRQHAEIRRVNGQWQIADMHSTNGLQYNGVRIQEHFLNNGDKFLLAPSITVTFYNESTQSAPAPSPTPSGATSRPNWAQSFAQQPTATNQPPPPQQYASLPPAAQSQQPAPPFRAMPSSPAYAAVAAASPGPTAGPAGPAIPAMPAPVVPSAPSPAAPFVPPNSVAPLKPRSVFADDEVQFVPASMAPISPTPPPPPAPRSWGNATPPASFEPPVRPAAPRPSMPPFVAGGSPPTAQTPPSGYPAPLGPMMAGSDVHDLYHRSSGGPAPQGRATSGPASKLLHVCQTCGQLTAPDSVYCQNCHHTIAQECVNCRLSLLPIQDRCPRCHTPNSASVRRKNPHRADA